MLFDVGIYIQTLKKTNHHKDQHRPYPSKPLFYTKQHLFFNCFHFQMRIKILFLL